MRHWHAAGRGRRSGASQSPAVQKHSKTPRASARGVGYGSISVGHAEPQVAPEGVLYIALGDPEFPLGLPGLLAAGALIAGHVVWRRQLRIEPALQTFRGERDIHDGLLSGRYALSAFMIGWGGEKVKNKLVTNRRRPGAAAAVWIEEIIF